MRKNWLRPEYRKKVTEQRQKHWEKWWIIMKCCRCEKKNISEYPLGQMHYHTWFQIQKGFYHHPSHEEDCFLCSDCYNAVRLHGEDIKLIDFILSGLKNGQ